MPGAQTAGVFEFGDLVRALEERGYVNAGELDGPGTFAVCGGTVDVFPGNLAYPVRLDFFGDELEEIRPHRAHDRQTSPRFPARASITVVEFSCSKSGLARARKKLERPAATNPALREMLEKMEGGLRFDGADRAFCPTCTTPPPRSATTRPPTRLPRSSSRGRFSTTWRTPMTTCSAARRGRASPRRACTRSPRT